MKSSKKLRFILSILLASIGGFLPQGHSAQLLSYLPFEHRIRVLVGPSNTLITSNPLMLLELAGVALFDYDNDGDVDVYLTNGPGFENALLENDNGTFIDVSERAGVDFRGGTGAVTGDIDNDGDNDLFVARRNKNVLFRNNGDGSFTNITSSAGVAAGDQISLSAAFCDFDNDSFLDLYVNSFLAQPEDTRRQNLLYHNNGDLTFSEISKAVGVANPITRSNILDGRGQNTSWAASCLDYDNDGDQDLAVAVDFATVTLFRNQWQETGRLTFANVTLEAGLGAIGNWMGLAVADFDNDGFLDMFATNWGNSPWFYALDSPVDTLDHAFYLNNGNGTFTEVAERAGIAKWAFGWGTTALDWDNDGDVDLYYAGNFIEDVFRPIRDNPGHLFLNDGRAHFSEASTRYGTINQDEQGTYQVGHGVATGDLNADGYFDIIVANAAYRDKEHNIFPGIPVYFKNDPLHHDVPGHWLKVKLIGAQSNHNGIGARVTVFAGGRQQLREVASGSGHLTQNSLELGFGLGRHLRVDRIEVRWPSGTIDVIEDVTVNQTLTILEDHGMLES